MYLRRDEQCIQNFVEILEAVKVLGGTGMDSRTVLRLFVRRRMWECAIDWIYLTDSRV